MRNRQNSDRRNYQHKSKAKIKEVATIGLQIIHLTPDYVLSATKLDEVSFIWEA